MRKVKRKTKKLLAHEVILEKLAILVRTYESIFRSEAPAKAINVARKKIVVLLENLKTKRIPSVGVLMDIKAALGTLSDGTSDCRLIARINRTVSRLSAR